MGSNAAFSRSGALGVARAWWEDRTGPARTNTVLSVVVGLAVITLMGAAIARDDGRPNPLANATRPQLSTGSIPATTSTSIDLRAAGVPGVPLPVPDQSTTSSTVAVALTVPQVVAAPPASVGTTTTVAPAPSTTVADPGVVFPQIPPDPSPPTTLLSAPATTVPPTTPPATSPPTTAPPPPTTRTTPTTAPLLPPLTLPPVLGLG